MSTNSMSIYQDEEQLELVSRVIEGGYSQNKNYNTCQVAKLEHVKMLVLKAQLKNPHFHSPQTN
jgi:hypothetical protein